MTRYFLVNNASTAANYGIGTHFRHLLKSLEHLDDIEVVFVDLQCTLLYGCQEIQDENGRRHLQIPLVNVGVEDVSYNRNVFAEIVRWNESLHETTQLVFHFHYEQHFLLASLLKAQIPSCRIIYTVHCQTWAFSLQGNRLRLQQCLAHEQVDELSEEQRMELSQIRQMVASEKRMLAIADDVLVLSEFTRKILVEDYKISATKLHLIPNAVADNDETDVIQLDDSNAYILYVGRLDKGKGIVPLMSAFRMVRNAVPHARLIIAGSGNYDECFSEVKDLWPYVSWTGRIDAEYLSKLYRSVSVGVLPSFNEQCSYTIIEMLMHGLPVVGSDCSGVAEMLDHSPNLRASFEKSRDDNEQMAKELAEILIKLLSDKEKLQVERKKARVAYEHKYALNIATQRLTNLLNQPQRPMSENDDLLSILDERVLSIINHRPDYMDLDVFGLAGVGYYLWWRISHLDTSHAESKERSLLLREHLLYTLDWMLEQAIEEDSTGGCHRPWLRGLAVELLHSRFFPIKVSRLLELLQNQEETRFESSEELFRNMLRICNYK